MRAEAGAKAEAAGGTGWASRKRGADHGPHSGGGGVSPAQGDQPFGREGPITVLILVVRPRGVESGGPRARCWGFGTDSGQAAGPRPVGPLDGIECISTQGGRSVPGSLLRDEGTCPGGLYMLIRIYHRYGVFLVKE